MRGVEGGRGREETARGLTRASMGARVFWEFEFSMALKVDQGHFAKHG